MKYLARIIGAIVAVIILGVIMPTRGQPAVKSQQPGNQKTYLPMVSNWVVQNGPSVYTVSYYMSTISTGEHYNRGCDLGKRDQSLPGIQENIVVLDYGGPRDSNGGRLPVGVYGSRLFGPLVHVSTSQIAAAVQSFGVGYYVCTGTDTLSTLVIGIGTNNWTDPNATPAEKPIYAVTYNHGRAWAQMVNVVNSWFVTNGYSRQVSAVGANDIELSWNTYTATRNWLDGYDSVNLYEMVNFGAIPGCPYFASPGAQCGTYPYIWSKEEVWHVIWGSPPVYPLPQIYANSGVNAQQWYLMSVYAYQTHGLAVEFRGVMTQSLSCIDRPDSICPLIDNTPLEGWTQLNSLINGDSRTAHALRWSTDIAWNKRTYVP